MTLSYFGEKQTSRFAYGSVEIRMRYDSQSKIHGVKNKSPANNNNYRLVPLIMDLLLTAMMVQFISNCTRVILLQ